MPIYYFFFFSLSSLHENCYLIIVNKQISTLTISPVSCITSLIFILSCHIIIYIYRDEGNLLELVAKDFGITKTNRRKCKSLQRRLGIKFACRE